MTTEYRLSHTAAEIDRRLSAIDNLAEKKDIPKKTSDLTNDSGFATENYVHNYAQPKDDYALKGDIKVTSVNGKTGSVNLTASDVGADENGTANSTVLNHNTSTDAHEDIRMLIEEIGCNILNIDYNSMLAFDTTEIVT